MIGTGLWLIGVPSAALWGILAAILRFVPYIGALISAVFPLVLAAAVDPGWTTLLWTAALFLAVEPIVGHVIEPMLYGHSTGLSPIAVVLSATFWTSLWGPIGLVLATPLTICLVVLGRHVERLQFLDVMFGDRPALSPPEIFYQRMLAGDPTEALDKAEEFLKERPLSTYYDDVALKGLKLAAADVARGLLDAAGTEKIKAVTKELVDDLDDQDDSTEPSAKTQDAEAAAAVETVEEEPRDLPVLKQEELALEWQADKPVLCIAGRGHSTRQPAPCSPSCLRSAGSALGSRARRRSACPTSCPPTASRWFVFRIWTRPVPPICVTSSDARGASGPMPGSFSAAGWPMGMLRHLRRR